MQRNKTSSIVEHAKKAESSAQTEIDEFCNVYDYPERICGNQENTCMSATLYMPTFAVKNIGRKGI